MEIERIDPTHPKAIKQFLTFPLSLYRDSKYWVCPILSDQRKFLQPDSPFFEHADGELYLVRDSGKIVGRIGAVVNHRYNEFQQEKTGFFGFWECVNDKQCEHLTRDVLTRCGGMSHCRIGIANQCTSQNFYVDVRASLKVLHDPYEQNDRPCPPAETEGLSPGFVRAAATPERAQKPAMS